MKKLMLIAALLSLTVWQSGCSNEFRPNTRKGWHMDEIDKHTNRISELNPVIYRQNERLLPQKSDQLGDVSAFQNRMRSRMSGMKGGN